VNGHEDNLGIPGTLGWLRAKVQTLESEIKNLRSDVIAIKTKIDETKGGFHVLGWMVAAAAAAGALAQALISWWGRGK
jgi:hypothetical protein